MGFASIFLNTVWRAGKMIAAENRRNKRRELKASMPPICSYCGSRNTCKKGPRKYRCKYFMPVSNN